MRVLLLAFSGVRVEDPELRAKGLTLPGFVDRSRVIASLPSLGLLTLAAHTPPDVELEYREVEEATEDLAAGILDEDFDLVAVSCLTARIEDAYRFAGLLREGPAPVALGGLHASTCPEEAGRHFDIVLIGEGEITWPALLQDLRRGRCRDRYDATGIDPRGVAFGDGPIPRFDLLEGERYTRFTIQTSRGCPLACDFCGASRLLGPYRAKPATRVRAELDALEEVRPGAFLELADDNTFRGRDRSRELARVLAERPRRWFTETDLGVADDPELLELLAASGCAQLLIGFESVRREPLVDLDGRGFKARLWEGYADRIARIQSHGISVNGCFVLGFDTDDAAVFDETLEFVRRTGLAEVQITLLTPFPGTPLRARLAREGRLLEEAGWRNHTLFDPTFHPAGMPVAELRARFHDLMERMYAPEEVTRRRAIFRDCWRTSARRRDAAEGCSEGPEGSRVGVARGIP